MTALLRKLPITSNNKPAATGWAIRPLWLLVAVAVLFLNQGQSQTKTLALAKSSTHDSTGSKDTSASPSVLGIYRGEALRSVTPHMKSLGFATIPCSTINRNPAFVGQCFQRGVDEAVSVWFKGDLVQGVGYDFSGSLYDGVWNGLREKYGNARAAMVNGWLYDFWQSANKHNIVEIQKIINGTGSISLHESTAFDNGIATEIATSPSQNSEPISGKLSLTPLNGINLDSEPEQQRGCVSSSDDCIVITVLSAKFINITARDPNGYIVSRSKPIQRLAVSLHGKTPSDGAWYKGQSYRTADILCLQACSQSLTVGKTYRMRMAVEPTFAVQVGYVGPYLTFYDSQRADSDGIFESALPNNAVVPAWQILELCSPNSRCVALSTINDR